MIQMNMRENDTGQPNLVNRVDVELLQQNILELSVVVQLRVEELGRAVGYEFGKNSEVLRDSMWSVETSQHPETLSTSDGSGDLHCTYPDPTAIFRQRDCARSMRS